MADDPEVEALREHLNSLVIPPVEQPTTDRQFLYGEGDDLYERIVNAGKYPFCTWSFELNSNTCNGE